MSSELGKEREREREKGREREIYFSPLTSVGLLRVRVRVRVRVSMRNRTSDLRIPRSDALPLSHRDSMVSEIYYEFEVHVTRVPHTAKISNVNGVMFVNRIAEMVVFYSCHERGIKNIFLSFFTELKTYHFSYSIYKHELRSL